MGRPATPDKVKKLKGTWQPCRSRPDEPQPQPGLPECPKWISDGAKVVWRRTVKALAGSDLLTQADHDVLVQYCELQAQFEAAVKALQLNPDVIIQTPQGPKENPALFLMRKLAQTLRPLVGTLGLSPLDRPKLAAPKKKDSPNPFEAFKALQ